jgi:hypothetical protein
MRLAIGHKLLMQDGESRSLPEFETVSDQFSINMAKAARYLPATPSSISLWLTMMSNMTLSSDVSMLVRLGSRLQSAQFGL